MDLGRLKDTLIDAGLPIKELAFSKSTREEGWYPRSDGCIMVQWTTTPTQTQKDQAASIILSFDATPTIEEKMDGIIESNKVKTALLIRASSKWTDGSLTAQQKTKIMAVIDDAATKAVQQVTN